MRRSGLKPAVFVGGYEVVVGEVGISLADAIDFLGLARREDFFAFQRPDALQQPLAPQDFVHAGNTAGEGMGRVEKGGIGVGNLGGEREDFGGDGLFSGLDSVQLLQELDGRVGPAPPLAQQSSLDMESAGGTGGAETKWRDEIVHDAVIIPGVEGDGIHPAAAGQRAHDIIGPISIEGRDLDSDHRFDFHQFLPERVREMDTAHPGEKVESE